MASTSGEETMSSEHTLVHARKEVRISDATMEQTTQNIFSYM